MLVTSVYDLKSSSKIGSFCHESHTYQPFNILLSFYLHKINIFNAYY
ncbi:hypothetical protein SAMN05216490_4577 [Mucilaginibacter mallensis]|uniref:Uncharacterized protein n=1 Tax=Mucilaginibacter mallensis TaxID=652787 RepID=A0A1H2C2L4_MUCMA|nr:hypothetical protein [Mucilaginibacter sp. X5P1]SDT64785.1 hypothetical protein SAMN05216490_4577 [Mucilaginibacter mallensis]